MTIDPSLKALFDANSNALAALLTKIGSWEVELAEDISRVSATDADLKSAIAGIVDTAPPTEPPIASD